MRIIRTEYLQTGIFGELELSPNVILSTLEHAYGIKNEDKSQTLWTPKIAEGMYTCVRGIHQLEALPGKMPPPPFQTFQIMGIPDFSGKPVTKCLFHPGNTENDSHGCVLLGDFQQGSAIFKSRDAFAKFMAELEGINNFPLTILRGDFV
jgi:hypothetical protein